MIPIGWLDVILVVVMPMVAWALAGRARGRHDLWFIVGTGLFAVAGAIVLLSPAGLTSEAKIVVRISLYTTAFMMTEYFRRLLNRESNIFVFAALVGFGVAALSVITVIDGVSRAGDILHHCFLGLIQINLLILLFRVRQVLLSRGILSIAFAIGFVLVANLTQLISILATGSAFSITGNSVGSQIIYLANILCVVLYSFGYLAFRAESARTAEVAMAEARAAEEERRRSAEMIAASSKAQVSQRNQYIFAQSRFEARNNLALFNAAVIHEISQPLQKLSLNVSSIASESSPLPQDVALKVEEISRDVGSVVRIVQSLRSLLVDISPNLQTITVEDAIAPIRSIAVAEAALRGVDLQIDHESLEQGDAIHVDPVLFGRVLLNLISNAFASFEEVVRYPDSSGETPRITVKFSRGMFRETPVILMTCRDNGIGPPPPGLIRRWKQQFSPNRAEGWGSV